MDNEEREKKRKTSKLSQNTNDKEIKRDDESRQERM